MRGFFLNDDDDQIDITVTLNGREEDEGKVFDVGSGFENKKEQEKFIVKQRTSTAKPHWAPTVWPGDDDHKNFTID